MKKNFTLFLAVLFFLCLPKFSFSQPQDALSSKDGLRINPGAQIEYFTRTVNWGEDTDTSELTSYFLALNVELAINEGFSISALAGYAVSDYESLVFRRLPFSVELADGKVEGYIFGAGLKKSLFYLSDFELGLTGQFLYQIGQQNTWDIPDLNVTGSVTGKPTWMRASAGLYIEYTGLASLVPYLSLCYDNFWGTFEMEQKIQSLEGTEEKEFKSKGLANVTIGSILTLSESFFLKGEVHLLPYGNGMDMGFMAIAAFSF